MVLHHMHLQMVCWGGGTSMPTRACAFLCMCMRARVEIIHVSTTQARYGLIVKPMPCVVMPVF